MPSFMSCIRKIVLWW